MDRKKFDIWFEEANNDFEMGEILFNSRKFNGAVFHFIQAAEKAIKAILYLFNFQPWGHSLINLLMECEKVGVLISTNLKNGAKKLEDHYTKSKYPDALPYKAPKDVYTEEIAIEIRKCSEIFLDFIKNEVEARFSNES